MSSLADPSLPEPLDLWLQDQAEALHAGTAPSAEVIPRLAEAGLFRIGVPQSLGGSGGSTFDAFRAISAVAERSLTAGFMFWGHRAFIEYAVQSENAPLRTRVLPELLDGRLSGATGLSNAMKHLAGIENLGIRARPDGASWRLDGNLPWITNVRPGRFIGAAAVEMDTGGIMVVALPSNRDGLKRSADLDLIALKGSDTASIELSDVRIGDGDIITKDGRAWLQRVRPAFLGLQFGLSFGVARAALKSTAQKSRGSGPVLSGPIAAVTADLLHIERDLAAGLADGRYVSGAAGLFKLRIRLADVVQQAVTLELQSAGGSAYLASYTRGFSRRWLEAAFIPVVTPSVTQLLGALQASDVRKSA